MKRFTIVSALALLVGACGGSSAEDPTTTVGIDATTTASTVGDTTTSEVAETNPDEGPSGGFSATCVSASQDMAEAMAAYGQGLGALMTGNLDANTFELIAGQLEAAAEAAPAEIADDFRIIAEEMGAFYRALSEMDYTPGQVPTEEQAAQMAALGEAMDAEALQEASDNINAWYEDNCGS